MGDASLTMCGDTRSCNLPFDSPCHGANGCARTASGRGGKGRRRATLGAQSAQSEKEA